MTKIKTQFNDVKIFIDGKEFPTTSVEYKSDVKVKDSSKSFNDYNKYVASISNLPDLNIYTESIKEYTKEYSELISKKIDEIAEKIIRAYLNRSITESDMEKVTASVGRDVDKEIYTVYYDLRMIGFINVLYDLHFSDQSINTVISYSKIDVPSPSNG